MLYIDLVLFTADFVNIFIYHTLEFVKLLTNILYMYLDMVTGDRLDHEFNMT